MFSLFGFLFESDKREGTIILNFVIMNLPQKLNFCPWVQIDNHTPLYLVSLIAAFHNIQNKRGKEKMSVAILFCMVNPNRPAPIHEIK